MESPRQARAFRSFRLSLDAPPDALITRVSRKKLNASAAGIERIAWASAAAFEVRAFGFGVRSRRMFWGSDLNSSIEILACQG
jgi:hypothetical protein